MRGLHFGARIAKGNPGGYVIGDRVVHPVERAVNSVVDVFGVLAPAEFTHDAVDVEPTRDATLADMAPHRHRFFPFAAPPGEAALTVFAVATAVRLTCRKCNTREAAGGRNTAEKGGDRISLRGDSRHG